MCDTKDITKYVFDSLKIIKRNRSLSLHFTPLIDLSALLCDERNKCIIFIIIDRHWFPIVSMYT